MGNQTRVLAAGFVNAYIGVRDTNGNLIGGTATAPTAGQATGNPMVRLFGAKTSDINVPAPVETPVTGDDTTLATFLFDPANLPAFNMDVAIHDLTATAMMQRSKVHNLGNTTHGLLFPKGAVLEDMCMILQSQAKSGEVTDFGVAKWQGVSVPSCSMKSLGQQGFTEKAASMYRVRVVTNMSPLMIWGLTLTQALDGYEAAPLIPFSSNNPMIVERFTGGLSRVAFTLSKTPIAATVAAPEPMYVTVNGLPRAMTTDYTFNATTKVLTFAVAPGTDAIILVYYEHVP